MSTVTTLREPQLFLLMLTPRAALKSNTHQVYEGTSSTGLQQEKHLPLECVPVLRECLRCLLVQRVVRVWVLHGAHRTVSMGLNLSNRPSWSADPAGVYRWGVTTQSQSSETDFDPAP